MTPSSFLKKTIPAFVFLLLLLFPVQLKADKWRFISDEREALQCRFDLINQAKHEILFSYYIFRDDIVGKAVLHLAVEAARERGVKVKIIIDQHGKQINKKIRAYLAAQGVELKKFQVKRFSKYGIFRGLHEKKMVIEGKWVLTGGRNIEGKYFDLDANYNFKDLEVLVEGVNVGRTARFHFFESWYNSKVSFPLKFSKRHTKKKDKVAKDLNAAYSKLSFSFPKGYNPNYSWLDDTYTTEHPIRFIHDDLLKVRDSIFVTSDVKDNKCTEELLALLRTAKRHIIIENAYFIPTRLWMDFFEEAQKKGIKITVLANSMQSNDLNIYHAAYLNRRKKLLKLGLEIWEYQGPKKLHLKTIIIDGKVSIVGSYNIHFPSETLNTEVAVVVEDSAVANDHLQMIEQNFLNAVRINKKNKAVYPKKHNFPKPTLGRKLAVFFSRYTIALWFNKYL